MSSRKGVRYVYALMDHKGAAFYVGQTNDIEMRLLEHISSAVNKKRRGEFLTTKEQHINFLVETEGWPFIVILRKGEWTFAEALHVENEIYYKLLNAGHQLLNAGAPLEIEARKHTPSFLEGKR